MEQEFRIEESMHCWGCGKQFKSKGSDLCDKCRKKNKSKRVEKENDWESNFESDE